MILNKSFDDETNVPIVRFLNQESLGFGVVGRVELIGDLCNSDFVGSVHCHISIFL